MAFSYVKILRVLRVLRPLRAINRAKGLKVSRIFIYCILGFIPMGIFTLITCPRSFYFPFRASVYCSSQHFTLLFAKVGL